MFGSRVSARGLAWDVMEVVPLGAQTLLRLRCAAGDMSGLEWELLHPAEPVEMLRAELRREAPGSLTGWRLQIRPACWTRCSVHGTHCWRNQDVSTSSHTSSFR